MKPILRSVNYTSNWYDLEYDSSACTDSPSAQRNAASAALISRKFGSLASTSRTVRRASVESPVCTQNRISYQAFTLRANSVITVFQEGEGEILRILNTNGYESLQLRSRLKRVCVQVALSNSPKKGKKKRTSFQREERPIKIIITVIRRRHCV